MAGSDDEMARSLEKVLKKQGMNFYLQAKVTGATPRPNSEQLDDAACAFEWEGKK